MRLAILLYDRFTALDAVGPYEVLSNAGQRTYDHGLTTRSTRQRGTAAPRTIMA